MARRVAIELDLPRLIRLLDKLAYLDVQVSKISDELYMVGGTRVGIYPGFREQLRRNLDVVMQDLRDVAGMVGINAVPLSLLLHLLAERMGPAFPFSIARYEILTNPTVFELTIAKTRYGYMVVLT